MITILAGGTGSVKLVRGLAMSTSDMTVISNVGDNIWLHGLYVCPDIDTVIYGLSGVLDEQRGWGIKKDSFECLAQLKKLGLPTWFSLGDRDIATHLLRTNMLKGGKSLSDATNRIRYLYSVTARVIPATDSELTTVIITSSGEMHLQEFWVKHKGAPEITGIRYKGAIAAVASRDAIDAIRHSETIVVSPANPVSSIGPIIAIAELRRELRQNRQKVIAISPFIGKKAISGPAAKYMNAIGIESSPLGVAQYYQDFVGTFVISKSDHRFSSFISALDMRVYETNIIMKSRQDEANLGKLIINKIRK